MARDKSRHHIGVDGTPFFRPIDGIGRYSHELLKELAEQKPDYRFTIIGFRGDKPNAELVDNLPRNVEFFYLPIPRKIYQGLFSKLIAVNLSLIAPRFDSILHLNFTLFPYIKRRGLKNLLFVHDTTFIDIPEVVTKKNLRYLRRRVPWSIKRAEKIITISDFTKSRIKDIYRLPPSKISMVGTGVQKVFFEKAKKPRGLPGKYVLAIGTLEPRKNLESLVKAYLALPKDLRNKYALVLGGSLGWDNDELRRTIESSSKIHHLGYVDDKDLPGLYQSASLFVFPSLYEGFGIPLLEAMASEVPVIANDIPLFKDIAKNNVIYTNATDINELSNAISKALSAKLDKTRLAKTADHASQYSWESVARMLLMIMGDSTLR